MEKKKNEKDRGKKERERKRERGRKKTETQSRGVERKGRWTGGRGREWGESGAYLLAQMLG